MNSTIEFARIVQTASAGADRIKAIIAALETRELQEYAEIKSITDV